MLVWEILSKENVIKMIVTGLPTLLIAAIVPFISIKFALKQFYTQKWWETKASTYSKIIENLSSLEYTMNQLYEHEALNIINLSDSALKKFIELRSHSYDVISQMNSTGSYIISNECWETLRELLKSLEYRNKDGNWIDDYEVHLSAIGDALTKIRDIAKRDLRVK
ncbi:hypothetical protein [Paenibacillus spongiae]|uniref:Uncharacterized protein n=1 Tax=Paenibacillus spongiae TaxID=2909671 RepID=A0ABY5SDR7_9BACL|nr:hypothetical protein [Paenibacillus spongiae]UVI32109.1 hypothetical protein L1F29_09930 [Paenibacillus spongiae]